MVTFYPFTHEVGSKNTYILLEALSSKLTNNNESFAFALAKSYIKSQQTYFMSKISLLHVKLKALLLVKTRGHDRRPLFQATCYMTLFPVSLSYFIAGASFKLSASGPLRHDLGTVASSKRVY